MCGIFIVRGTKSCLSYIENEFNKSLVEKINTIEKDLSVRESTDLWKLLDNTLKRYKNNLLDKITKNVSNKNVKTIKDNLENLFNFSNIEKEEEEVYNDTIIKKNIYLNNMSNKRKEDYSKKFIFNYLVKYCKILSNIKNKNKTIVDKNERLEEKKLLGDEYSFLVPFFKEKNLKYFKLISNLLENVKPLRDITGYSDYYGCEIKIESSVCDYEKSGKLLELNFYYILSTIIDIIDNYEDSVKSLSGKNSEDKFMDNEEEEEENIGLDNKGYIIRHFIINLLKKIKSDNDFFNKNTQNTVIKEIKTKNEENKDRNLYVMEKLSREEINLRNLMTEAGLTKYENLATDYADVLKNDEIENNLIAQYEAQYGEKPKDEQKFLDFKLENEKFMREENDIRKDNMEFDQGDDEDEIFGL